MPERRAPCKAAAPPPAHPRPTRNAVRLIKELIFFIRRKEAAESNFSSMTDRAHSSDTYLPAGAGGASVSIRTITGAGP